MASRHEITRNNTVLLPLSGSWLGGYALARRELCLARSYASKIYFPTFIFFVRERYFADLVVAFGRMACESERDLVNVR